MSRAGALFLGAALAIAMPPAARAGDAFLSEGGTWIGSGTLRENARAPVQRGRCRLMAEPLPDGAGVTASGRCAGASGAANVNLRVERRGDGVVAAGFSSSLDGGVVQYLGRESATGITLHSRDPVPVDGRLYRGLLKVEWLANDAFLLSTALHGTDEDTEIGMIEMEFVRQGGDGDGGG